MAYIELFLFEFHLFCKLTHDLFVINLNIVSFEN